MSSLKRTVLSILFLKFWDVVNRHGLYFALSKTLQYFAHGFGNERKSDQIFRSSDIERRFTEIYKLNYWGNSESASGSGSTLEQTESIRRHLPALFEKFSIKTVFDAPCGDFNWMKYVLQECDINYIGADIVKSLIDKHSALYTNARSTFLHLDITKDSFPNADLWICRDCFFHFSFEDTIRALRLFADSGIAFLLTTTHKNTDGFENFDIGTGAFRFIDLFSGPYFFLRMCFSELTTILANRLRESYAFGRGSR